MAKAEMYECENCGALNTHIDSYNDKYCYGCIDIDTGELKKGDGAKKKNPATHLIFLNLNLRITAGKESIKKSEAE